MAGLYLLLVAALWLIFVFWISSSCTRRLATSSWRVPVCVTVFSALMPLPILDEIVGGRQFDQLCKENSVIRVDPSAAGKTVYLSPATDSEVRGTWVRIVVKPWRFVDAASGETLVSYNTLAADGGRLTRMLGISEGGVPLTFKGTCAPPNRPGSAQTFRRLGITYVEPPSSR